MDLTPLFEAVIALIGAILTAFVIPYIRAKTSEAQRDKLAAVVNTLVMAAEQLFGAGCGEEKLRYVIDALGEMGYTVDIDESGDAIRAMIEASVLHLAVGQNRG